MRGRANQADDATLHVGQQHILLRFIEPMNFIDEQDRGLVGVLEAIGCCGKHSAHFGDVGFHAAEPFELAPGLPGDDLRQ